MSRDESRIIAEESLCEFASPASTSRESHQADQAAWLSDEELASVQGAGLKNMVKGAVTGTIGLGAVGAMGGPPLAGFLAVVGGVGGGIMGLCAPDDNEPLF